MKKIINRCVLLLGGFGLIVLSCTKKIDDAYANPNADVRVPVEQLLPPIIATMAANGAGHGPYNDYRTFGKYVQMWHYYLSGEMYDRMSGRLVPLGSTAADQTASIFRAHYYDIGQNNMNMIKWAMEEKKWDYVGVGKAIFAWSWLQLTDVQGEVILKEAFDQSKLTFKYDTQEEVYDYVRQLCHEAISYLNMTGDGASPENLAKGDAFFYNGDVNKWKRFVYSVLARSYNHLTNKTDYKTKYADSVLKYTGMAFGITSNADNAMVKFAYAPGGVTGTANFFGPIRGNFTSTVDGSNYAIRQGAYIANLLNGTNSEFSGIEDPRAIYMIRKNADSTFKGIRQNKGQADLLANQRPENFWGSSQTTSVVNAAPGSDNNARFIFKNAAPLPVIIASEVWFMRAEAAYLKGDKGTALDAYRQGISLHFDLLTSTYSASIPNGQEITPAKKQAYLDAVVPASANDLTLSEIMLQKYIALFGIGVLEVWTDMRRYHYIDIDPVTQKQVYTDFVAPSGTDLYPSNGGKLVYRVYPRYNSETVWNIEELKRIGADKEDFHTYQPWFTKKD